MSRPNGPFSRAPKGEQKTSKPRTAAGIAGGILGLVGMSAVAGVLATAAITPAVALTGIGAGTTISMFENLPDVLNINALAQPSTLYAQQADGSWGPFATFYFQDRIEVGWDDVNQYVKDAAVSAEDPRFYEHGGVDVLASARALVQNQLGDSISGASTITMQYVKNVLVQQAEALKLTDEQAGEAAYEEATRTDIDRKLKEMRLAIGVEKQYSKDQILMGYLNITLFGGTVYGIEAASEYYFGKTAKDLSLAEAASLVAIPNNPSKFRLDNPDNIQANQTRRDYILQNMLSQGRITQEQYEQAVATPVEPHITPKQAGCDAASLNNGLGFFCDYVRRYLLQDPKFGSTQEERDTKLQTGGLQIYTTINLGMQAAGVQATQDAVPNTIYDNIDVGSASVSVEVGTGHVLTMVQNKNFSADPDTLNADQSYTAVNYNTDYNYGGSIGFPVGSTFKAFTLAEWIHEGKSLNTVVDARRRVVKQNTFRDRCNGGTVEGEDWKMTNDHPGPSSMSVLQGTLNSTNGVFVSMAQQMDLCDIFDLARALGVHRADGQPLLQNPSNILGTNEIAPITMATAYAGFASGGVLCDPVPIVKITDSGGTEVPFTNGNCRQAIDQRVAAGVDYALQAYIDQGGLARYARSENGTPHMAKTGTSDSVVDSWTVGGSTKVITATWVGAANPTCDGSDCGRQSLYTAYYNGSPLYLADQDIWPAIMDQADAIYGGADFPTPDSAVNAPPKMATVPDVRGKSYADAAQLLEGLGFAPAQGDPVDSDLPTNQVAGTSPSAGSQVPAGSTISISMSLQNLFPVPDTTGMTQAQAQGALSGWAIGSQLCTDGSKPPSGATVASSNPSAGSLARHDSPIQLSYNCKAQPNPSNGNGNGNGSGNGNGNGNGR